MLPSATRPRRSGLNCTAQVCLAHTLGARRHEQHSAREGACRKRPKCADHDCPPRRSRRRRRGQEMWNAIVPSGARVELDRRSRSRSGSRRRACRVVPVSERSVVIAGGGPTGLMLAGELALAGVDVVIVERRATQELDGPRAGGLHARTIEVLDQRGVAERFVSEGQRYPALGFGQIAMDISDFPSRHNYLLGLWQRDIERILAEWVLGDLAVPIVRRRQVAGFTQDDSGVTVDVAGDAPLRAEYLVGCDGGRSVIRKAAGIDFPGVDASASWMIAEVEMEEEPLIGVRPEGGGIGPVNRVEGGGPYGVVLREQEVEHTGEPTLQELKEALIVAYGTDYGAHSPTRLSRFT